MNIADEIRATIARIESLVLPLRNSQKWADAAAALFLELDHIRETLRRLPEHDPRFVLDPHVTNTQWEKGEGIVHTKALFGDEAGSRQAIEREVGALVESAKDLNQLRHLKLLLRKTYESIVVPPDN
jgi:hypothetical protein